MLPARCWIPLRLIRAPEKTARNFGGRVSRLESFHVHAAGQIKKFSPGNHGRETSRPPSLIRQAEVSQSYSSMKRFRSSNESGFPFSKARLVPAASQLSAVALCFCRHHDARLGISTARGNAALFGYLQRSQTVARPAVKQIVTAGGKFAANAIQSRYFFLRRNSRA